MKLSLPLCKNKFSKMGYTSNKKLILQKIRTKYYYINTLIHFYTR